MGIAPILPCAEPLAKKQDWPIHGRGFAASIGTPVYDVDLALFITGADCIYLPMSVNTYIARQAPLMAHLHFTCLFHRTVPPNSFG